MTRAQRRNHNSQFEQKMAEKMPQLLGGGQSDIVEKVLMTMIGFATSGYPPDFASDMKKFEVKCRKNQETVYDGDVKACVFCPFWSDNMCKGSYWAKIMKHEYGWEIDDIDRILDFMMGEDLQ